MWLLNAVYDEVPHAGENSTKSHHFPRQGNAGAAITMTFKTR